MSAQLFKELAQTTKQKSTWSDVMILADAVMAALRLGLKHKIPAALQEPAALHTLEELTNWINEYRFRPRAIRRLVGGPLLAELFHRLNHVVHETCIRATPVQKSQDASKSSLRRNQMAADRQRVSVLRPIAQLGLASAARRSDPSVQSISPQGMPTLSAVCALTLRHTRCVV